MKRTLLTGLGLFVAVQMALAQPAGDPAKKPSGTPLASLKANGGDKWPTDEPLRAAMERLHSMLGRATGKLHRGTFSNDDFASWAQIVRLEVDYMDHHRKLEPAAEAQLRLVIAALLDSAQRMESGPGLAIQRDAVLSASRAVRAYARYFDHPGWNSE